MLNLNNEAIQDAYAGHHAECLAMLEQIRERLEDAPAPSDQTHWGNVADMAHLADQLREIVDPK